MKPLIYESENYEILIQNNVFIKDKKKKSYYRNDLNSIDTYKLKRFKNYPEKVHISVFSFYITFNIIMVLINNIFNLNLQKYIAPEFSNMTILIVFFYFLINVFFHELGHIISLKYFDKKIDKVGFKLNYFIFPSFYVQMNETYMLSRIDKIIVHSFGLFVNYTTINLIQLLNVLFINSNALTISYVLFSSTMIWNLVPILNSDGYKIMLAALCLDEYKNYTKNHWIILIFQLIGVTIALNTLVHWIIYWSKYLYT